MKAQLDPNIKDDESQNELEVSAPEHALEITKKLLWCSYALTFLVRCNQMNFLNFAKQESAKEVEKNLKYVQVLKSQKEAFLEYFFYFFV